MKKSPVVKMLLFAVTLLVLIGGISLLVLKGCNSSPRLDCSTDESGKLSSAKMILAASDEEIIGFTGAMLVMGFKGQLKDGTELNGMTIKEVIDKAKELNPTFEKDMQKELEKDNSKELIAEMRKNAKETLEKK